MAVTRRTLLAVALVALAGCSGLGGPGATERLTPAPVPATPTPTEAPTPTPGASAPAVSDLVDAGVGVNESFALAAAHRRALAPAGFTRVTSLTVSDEDGVLRDVSRRLSVAPGGRPYLLVVRSRSRQGFPVEALAPRIDVYYEDPRALVRLVDDGNVSYFKPPRPRTDGPVNDRPGDARLTGLLATFEEIRVAAPGDDGAVHVLRARRAVGPAVLDVPALLEDPRNVTFRAEVTPSGLVRRYSLRYAATFDGREVTVVRTVRFVAVGETTVDRPPWHEAAVNATGDDWAPLA